MSKLPQAQRELLDRLIAGDQLAYSYPNPDMGYPHMATEVHIVPEGVDIRDLYTAQQKGTKVDEALVTALTSRQKVQGVKVHLAEKFSNGIMSVMVLAEPPTDWLGRPITGKTKFFG